MLNTKHFPHKPRGNHEKTRTCSIACIRNPASVSSDWSCTLYEAFLALSSKEFKNFKHATWQQQSTFYEPQIAKGMLKNCVKKYSCLIQAVSLDTKRWCR